MADIHRVVAASEFGRARPVLVETAARLQLRARRVGREVAAHFAALVAVDLVRHDEGRPDPARPGRDLDLGRRGLVLHRGDERRLALAHRQEAHAGRVQDLEDAAPPSRPALTGIRTCLRLPLLLATHANSS